MATSNYTATLAQLERQRWQCDQAAREQPAIVAWENALELAGSLAIDPKRKHEAAAILSREWAAYREAK